MKTPAKTPVQRAKTPGKQATPSASSAPQVVQARMAQFKNGPKITAPPVYRPAVKKVAQAKWPNSLNNGARTIQRAEEDPYKKEYKGYAPIKTMDRASARASPYGGGKAAKSARLQARGGGVRPNYVPARDSLGNDIWSGSRSGLAWSATITAGMAGSKAAGCTVAGDLCTGSADSIDHITDFADLQTGITTYKICDGAQHWKAAYKADAVSIYNNGDDTGNMRWACTQCNSQKGGVKGRYENQPEWLEACPGACGYALRGEEM